MIIGVGTDMIEIERVRKACGKQVFFYALFFRAGTGDDSRADGESSRQFCSQRGCGESIW